MFSIVDLRNFCNFIKAKYDSNLVTLEPQSDHGFMVHIHKAGLHGQLNFFSDNTSYHYYSEHQVKDILAKDWS